MQFLQPETANVGTRHPGFVENSPAKKGRLFQEANRDRLMF